MSQAKFFVGGVLFFAVAAFLLVISQQTTVELDKPIPQIKHEELFTFEEVQEIVKKALDSKICVCPSESNPPNHSFQAQEKPEIQKGHEKESEELKKDVGKTGKEVVEKQIEAKEPEEEEEEEDPNAHEDHEAQTELPMKKYTLEEELPELRSIAENDPNFKAALEKYAINNTIILSLCNFAFSEMLNNWRCTLEQAGMENYVNIAMDAEIHEASLANGIHSFLPKNAYSSKQFIFGTQGFKNFVKMKSAYVLSALNLGYDVLLSDNDIVFFKNPIPYIKSFGEQWDLIIQTDDRGTTESYFHKSLNSGFYFVRSNERTKQFFIQLLVEETARKTWSEQKVLNKIIASSQNFPIAFRILKRELFPNGFAIWGKGGLPGSSRRKPDPSLRSWSEPFMAHANWMKGTELKTSTLKNEGWWVTDDKFNCIKKIEQPLLPFKYTTNAAREQSAVLSRLARYYGDDYAAKIGWK